MPTSYLHWEILPYLRVRELGYQKTLMNRQMTASTAIVMVLVAIFQDIIFFPLPSQVGDKREFFGFARVWLQFCCWTFSEELMQKKFFFMSYDIPNATASIRWLNWDICLNCINRVIYYPKGHRWTLHAIAIIFWISPVENNRSLLRQSVLLSFPESFGWHEKMALSGMVPGLGCL